MKILLVFGGVLVLVVGLALGFKMWSAVNQKDVYLDDKDIALQSEMMASSPMFAVGPALIETEYRSGNKLHCALVVHNGKEKTNKYSLSTKCPWLHLTATDFELAPMETKVVPVTFEVPADSTLASGSQYDYYILVESDYRVGMFVCAAQQKWLVTMR